MATRMFFSDLKSGGKCSSVVEARLLRYWEARNVKRGGELMWVDMLMIDATIMQATIYANRLPRFRSKLAAGKMYSISGFDVARCAQSYRLSDSPLLIRFNELTDFEELTEPVSPLPEEGFRLRNQSELAGLANTNTQLPREIASVKSTVSDTLGDKNRIMATIKLDNETTVTLSLFDAQAVSFHKKLEDMNGDPRVIVATSINPKMVGGGLFLNATSGTHIYFDMETNAGEVYFYKLVARDTGAPPAAPLLKGYAKVETLTVSELNSFIASASSQEIDFICTGKVVRLDVDKGWCYVACSKCSKKLQRTVSALECMRCSNANAVGVLRCVLYSNYRVELAIADDTAEGAFVCFDGVMTKLHNLRASESGNNIMHATINASRLPILRSRLTAGSIYTISEPVSPLPEEGFRFRNQAELVGLANTNTQLPGEITAVKSVGDEHGEKNRVMVTIKLDNDTTVILSLFDTQAVSFHKKLEDMNGDPKVIVATSINRKMVGGGLFLNETSGTHIYFDKETNAGETYFCKLVARDARLPSAAPLLKGYAKVETLTISELNTFITSSPSQDIGFICTGKVVRLDLEKGWCYVACSKCKKKLQRTVTAVECARCSNANAVGVLRYRVELVIADNTAEGAFRCFDGVMTKLHNLRAAEAAQMLAAEGVNVEGVTMPPFITDMEGKTFTFQGGNNGDDADMPDGNKVTYQVETGEGSSDGDKKVKENLTAAAPKKRTHRPH
ncbi:hypothetical protein F2Q68_00015923 [Brassica cretica]|uniref:Replication factor A C-terminal domain-containing protein n=1 Tax=Brassica cretica TaxID=69181 RepID=A0A8S9H9Q1_BRACR|nr:hypothetical protein F2Q68_00015923 [Brassica cretica]